MVRSVESSVQGLVGCVLSLTLSGVFAADLPESAAQPFASGDVFVAATVMDDPNDDHGGTGRILQYDADLNLRGTLWVDGTRHKIGGLAFDQDGTLWGFAQLTPAVLRFSADAQQLPLKKWSDRSFSSVAFARDGSLYFGEHLAGASTSAGPNLTTTFRLLPGRDVIGDGWVFKYDRQGNELQSFKTDFHPVPPFLAITSIVLDDDGDRVIYVSENGNRVMQFDLANNEQLDDLAVLTPESGVPRAFVMVAFPDGRLLISTSLGFIVMDPDTGAILEDHKLGGMGWAAIAPGIDGEHVIVGNFFSGEFVKYNLKDRTVAARNNMGQKNSLSGIAQFGGVITAE